MEVLREIKDKAFDLLLTDPPYGIGASSIRFINGTSKTEKKYYREDCWDTKPISDSPLELCISKANKSIVWGGNYFNLPPCRCFLVWDKTIHGNSYADCEFAWTSADEVARIFRMNIVNVTTDGRCHPTQKPVALFVWCLLNYSKPGDLIIDPYCGSGTTALACHKTGRKFLCIDKDEEYIKIAQQRYADLIAQQDLFRQDEDARAGQGECPGTACNSGRDAMPLDIFEGVQ
jgi:site-specific DNA-methyltransferase (adenine-specific)